MNYLYETVGAGIEAFKNYFNLGLNFNSLREPLATDVSEVTIDVLNIIFFETEERFAKIKHSCAILLFTLAMPNENMYVYRNHWIRCYDLYRYFSPSNGQNILNLLDKSAKKWFPGRERFQCLVQCLHSPNEIAVNVSI